MNIAPTRTLLSLPWIALFVIAGLVSLAPSTLADDITLSTVTSISLNGFGIEVTQGIQNETHTVPLLGGRKTIARVYLNTTSTNKFGQVTGTLSLTPIVDGKKQTAIELANPINGSVSILDQWKDKLEEVRNYAMASLNFELPMDLVKKGKKYEVEVKQLRDTYNGSKAIPCANCATKSVTIEFKEEAPTFRLEVIGLTYTDKKSGKTAKPRLVDYEATKSWFPRAYPIGTFSFGHKEVDTGKTLDSGWNCGSANAKVTSIRTLDVDGNKMDYRTHYYGMVSDKAGFMRGCALTIPGTASPSTPASGPSGKPPITTASAVLNFDNPESFAGWYAGHEIGHTLGRKHVDCGGAVGTDGNYPFKNGQLAPYEAGKGTNINGKYVGFDMGDASMPMSALAGDKWTDIMGYCNQQWPSSYTYKALRKRIAEEDALPDPNAPAPGTGGVGPAARNPQSDRRQPGRRQPGRRQPAPLRERLVDGVEHFAVVALVNLTRRTGEITDVHQVSRFHLVEEHPTDRALLRLLDAEGRVLAARTAIVGEFSDREPGADQLGMVHSYLPMIAGGERIELILARRLLDVAEKSVAPPRAHTLTVPVDQARELIAAGRHDDIFEVTWGIDHPEAEKVTYSVQISEDGGRGWRTVAIGLTETKYDFSVHHIKDLRRFMVRVIANDGFDSHTVESEFHRLR